MSADKYKQLMKDLKQANASDANKPINTDQEMLLFLKNQQDTVFRDVIKQQDASFDKAYGDLQQAVKTQEFTTVYDKRNKDLANIQQSIYDKQQKSADAAINTIFYIFYDSFFISLYRKYSITHHKCIIRFS